jgi:hypothetical protein
MYLPLDVWHHIISFIPTEQLRTLYGVDHTFFNLAMNIRYKEVDLYRVDLDINRVDFKDRVEEEEPISSTLFRLQ